MSDKNGTRLVNRGAGGGGGKVGSVIQRLGYGPRVPYRLDLEAFTMADLRRRGSKQKVRTTHRYEFHMLLCVTHGVGTQVIDFRPVSFVPGSVLLVRPGQAHNFGHDDDWDGWMVLFRAEFLPSQTQTTADLLPVLGLDRLPDHLSLSAADFAAVNEAIARMQQDAAGVALPKDLHALLRYELCALLLRLAILQDQHIGTDAARSTGVQRYAKFRRLVEQNYAGWHQVSAYAAALGCTEKSLTRAALEATGQSAKSVVMARIALEAKRLLVHTDRPIYLIAEGLGFEEATNFGKFFRRETGVTPIGFRQQHKT